MLSIKMANDTVNIFGNDTIKHLIWLTQVNTGVCIVMVDRNINKNSYLDI